MSPTSTTPSGSTPPPSWVPPGISSTTPCRLDLPDTRCSRGLVIDRSAGLRSLGSSWGYRRFGAGREGHGLELQEALQAFGAALPAEARLLVAAEGAAATGGQTVVDLAGARADAAGDGQGPLAVGGVDRAAPALRRGVGEWPPPPRALSGEGPAGRARKTP